MAMVNPIPSSNSNHFQTYPLNSTAISNNPPREVSFSSYLNPTEEAYVHRLVQPGRSISFRAEPLTEHLFDLRSKDEDGEIGVFRAEKYYNGEIDRVESPKIATPSKELIQLEHKKEEVEGERSRDIVIEPIKPGLHMGALSARSESSLNSQSVLLQNITRKPSRKRGNTVHSSRSLLAAIGCRCSCSDKGSVNVTDNENITTFSTSLNGKSSNVSAFHTHRSAPMSDPWLNGEIQTRKSGKLGNFEQKTCFDLPSLKLGDGEVKPRKTLEVFGSPSYGKKENNKETFKLERRLTMLSTWDANPRKEAGPEVLDGTESDTSSELFEIESMTGKVNSYLARQTSDATSDCPTPTTARYAPSEVSIEWSVVTASAADFSVLSDSEGATSGMLAATRGFNQTKNGTKEAALRRRPVPGILLGCKSQKAVQVAEETHRTSSERFRLDPGTDLGQRPNPLANPVARFQAETKLMGFDHKYGKRSSHPFHVGK